MYNISVQIIDSDRKCVLSSKTTINAATRVLPYWFAMRGYKHDGCFYLPAWSTIYHPDKTYIGHSYPDECIEFRYYKISSIECSNKDVEAYANLLFMSEL